MSVTLFLTSQRTDTTLGLGGGPTASPGHTPPQCHFNISNPHFDTIIIFWGDVPNTPSDVINPRFDVTAPGRPWGVAPGPRRHGSGGGPGAVKEAGAGARRGRWRITR